MFDGRRRQSQERFFFDPNSPQPQLLNAKKEIDFSTPDRVQSLPPQVVRGMEPIQEEPMNMFNINSMSSPEQSVELEKKPPVRLVIKKS